MRTCPKHSLGSGVWAQGLSSVGSRAPSPPGPTFTTIGAGQPPASRILGQVLACRDRTAGKTHPAVRKPAGQQTAEFAVLIGLAVAVAVAMQLLARRAAAGGVKGLSDKILGAVPPSGCIDRNKDGVCDAINVTSGRRTTDSGLAGGLRTSAFVETVAGSSAGQQVTMRTIPDPGTRTAPPGTGVPPEPPDPDRDRRSDLLQP